MSSESIFGHFLIEKDTEHDSIWKADQCSDEKKTPWKIFVCVGGLPFVSILGLSLV